MASTGFVRKKVGTMTLGEKLRKIRNEYRISLHDVSKNTKIQIKYLEYLENGEYERLPAEVYVRGFVRSYAHYLGADEEVLIKLYDRERNIQKNIKKDQFQESRFTLFQFPHFIITPKLFAVATIFVLVFGSFWYLYQEFRSFAAVPYLVVFAPTDGQIIEESNVTVNGKTDKDARVSINGQPLLVDDSGNFSERVQLQSGFNTLTVTSTNKFQKEKVETLSVQANYASAAEGDANTEQTPLIFNEESSNSKPLFRVMVQGVAPIKVLVEVDGKVAFDGLMNPQENKEFEVEKEMKVSSDDGSRTLVQEPQKEFHPLSDVVKKVENVVFSVPDTADKQ